MVSFKPLQSSSAFRLWCKAKGMKIGSYDEVAKDLRNYKKEYLGEYKDDPKWMKLIEESQVFKGVIESIAPSPCSYLLYDKSISEEIGLMSIGSETSKNEKVLCCVLDGKNCDKYKYLKNDYLIVTCWDIISKVYQKLGKPIDDIKTLLSKCDDKVWKLYADGITATLNQADTDYDKQILMRYKPKSFEEMSAYVAAIRPGFASQLQSFVNREDYTTGVQELDDILKDSFHYMMYQENIMTYLTWLGIPQKETYDIIKKISKKIFTDKELRDLKCRLEQGWLKKVGTEEGFQKTWEIVELSASYSFNASHSASVALDSIYGAYLKATYPFEYYSVVFDIYSGDISKTSALTQELPYFGITLKEPRFRYASDKYMPDKEHNQIFKDISSIKFCNAAIAKALYELRDKQYMTFLDFLEDNPCNSRQTEILIKLGFFEEFGRSEKLLCIYDIYNKYVGRSEFFKSQVDDPYLFSKYCDETPKKYRVRDMNGLLDELCARLPDRNIPVSELISAQLEYMGYISYRNTKARNYVYVSSIDLKFAPKIQAYSLAKGTTSTLKMGRQLFNKRHIQKGDIIKIKKFERKNKCYKTDDGYVPIQGEYEFWIVDCEKVEL